MPLKYSVARTPRASGSLGDLVSQILPSPRRSNFFPFISILAKYPFTDAKNKYRLTILYIFKILIFLEGKKKKEAKRKRGIFLLFPFFREIYRRESRKIEFSDENATLEVYEARYSKDDSKESFVESGMVEWRER